jgi:hypothetical protein
MRARAAIAGSVLVAVAAGATTAGCSEGSPTRGAATAKTAATLFVGAINSGSGSGAAAISCTAFADAARSQARSGSDPGISFSLGSVTENGDSANAQLDQATNVGGTTQTTTFTLTLQKSGGLWLVCGQN